MHIENSFFSKPFFLIPSLPSDFTLFFISSMAFFSRDKSIVLTLSQASMKLICFTFVREEGMSLWILILWMSSSSSQSLLSLLFSSSPSIPTEISNLLPVGLIISPSSLLLLSYEVLPQASVTVVFLRFAAALAAVSTYSNYPSFYEFSINLRIFYCYCKIAFFKKSSCYSNPSSSPLDCFCSSNYPYYC